MNARIKKKKASLQLGNDISNAEKAKQQLEDELKLLSDHSQRFEEIEEKVQKLDTTLIDIKTDLSKLVEFNTKQLQKESEDERSAGAYFMRFILQMSLMFIYGMLMLYYDSTVQNLLLTADSADLFFNIFCCCIKLIKIISYGGLIWIGNNAVFCILLRGTKYENIPTNIFRKTIPEHYVFNLKIVGLLLIACGFSIPVVLLFMQKMSDIQTVAIILPLLGIFASCAFSNAFCKMDKTWLFNYVAIIISVVSLVLSIYSFSM